MPITRGQGVGLLLEALAKEEMWRLLCVLDEHGPRERKELEQLLAGMSRGRIDRHLVAGEHTGILSHERSRGLPPHARYGLRATRPHFELIYAAGRAWEADWALGAKSHTGTCAMKLAAHAMWVPVLAGLADGPRSLAELQARVGAPQTTLWRYLERLVADRLIDREEEAGGVVSYVGRVSTRRLAVVPVIAVSMEWSLGRVPDRAYASNLHDLVHVIAPLASVDADVGGDCHLHVDCDDCLNPDVYVRIHDGRLIPLPVPSRAPAVVAHATPAGWCDALLHCQPTAADRSGCRRLFAAMLEALNAALVPSNVASSLRQA